MKFKKLRFMGIIMVAAISMAGCARTTSVDTTLSNEAEVSGTTETPEATEISKATEATEVTEATEAGRLVAGFVIEENDTKDTQKKKMYPYVVRTESTVWYLAADDIELMGEEAFFAGLEEVLGMIDQDYADARKALEEYISEEVQPVVIYTDFCNKAEISSTAGAYCHPVSHFIKVFGDWKQAEYALLHEYVHYLTFIYTKEKPDSNFASEGIAEYISMLVCENRMCKKSNFGAPEEYLEKLKNTDFWDVEEDAIKLKDVYLYNGLVYANGTYIGQEYQNIELSIVKRTDEMQQYMHANDCSYIEAGCMTAYLVETYGLDTVMDNLDKNLMTMSEMVYGKEFSEVYKDFVIWINDIYGRT